ncbi:hypothetical protein ACP70R_042061 [Stipagrostis hirtigluma subsp. patula]
MAATSTPMTSVQSSSALAADLLYGLCAVHGGKVTRGTRLMGDDSCMTIDAHSSCQRRSR